MSSGDVGGDSAVAAAAAVVSCWWWSVVVFVVVSPMMTMKILMREKMTKRKKKKPSEVIHDIRTNGTFQEDAVGNNRAIPYNNSDENDEDYDSVTRSETDAEDSLLEETKRVEFHGSYTRRYFGCGMD